MDKSEIKKVTGADNSVRSIVPILFGMVVLGILTCYKLYFGMRLMEADSASDLVYANLLSKEGSLISDNWYFSTGIRIFDNELLFALLFKLFPGLGWWEIETLGTAIMNCLLGVSGVALARQLGMGHKSLWMFGFSLLPYGFSEYYYVLMHGCGYYVFANIEVFVMLSFYLASVNYRGRRKAGRWLEFGGFLFLSLIIGLQGIRLLECLYAPLLLSSAILFLYGFRQSNDSRLFFYAKKQGRMFWTAIAGTGMACVGFVINKFWLSTLFRWESMEELFFKEFSLEPVEMLASELMSNLGYLPNTELFTGRGLINIVSIAFGILILYMLAGVCRKKAVFQRENFITCFFLTALLIHAFVYLFLFQEYKARYMLPFFMVLPHVLLVTAEKRKAGAGKKLILVLAACSVLVSGNVMRYGHERGNHQRIDTDKQKEMADFLIANGYQYGFSTFWYGNSTVQLSNGQLEVVSLSSLDGFQKYEWLCPKDEIQYDWQEKTFLIVSDSQIEANQERAWNQEQRIIWQDGGICVFEYESVEEMNRVLEF